MRLFQLPCLMLVSMSLLSSLVRGVDAQESLPSISLIDDNRIPSWNADPYMSQVEEQRIIKWLKSRPKASQQVEVLGDLHHELATSAKLQLGIDVVLDQRTLNEIGVSAESPVLEWRDLVVLPGSDLVAVLEDSDLTYMIRRGMVEITTFDDADEHTVVRIYDMTALLPIIKQRGRSIVSASSLIVAIQSTVEPDSWENLGGRGTIQTSIANNRCLLIIAARSDIHLQVQSLLDQMAIAGQLEIRSHSPFVSGRAAGNGPFVQEENSGAFTNLFSVPSRGIPKSKW